MVAKPTINTPRFSTSGPNIEPSAGKKAAGWAVDERPPAQWLNWLGWSAGEWIDYFAQVFAGIPVTDLLINYANPSATAPLIDVTTTADTASTTFKLLFRFALGGTRHVSMYVGGSASSRRFVLVQNATWTGTAWKAEDTSAPAAAIALRGGTATDVFELLWHVATASTWADNAWTVGGFSALNAQTLHVTQPTGLSTTIEGDMLINGGLATHNVNANGLITTVDLTATGDVNLDAPVHITQPHLYLKSTVDIAHPTIGDTQPRRYVQVPLSSGLETTPGVCTYDTINGRWIGPASGAADGAVDFPIVLPRGTLQWNVQVIWQSPDSAHANHLTLFRNVRDFTLASGLPPISEILATWTQGIFFSGTVAVTDGPATPQTDAVDPAFVSLFVRVFLKINPALNSRLYAVRYWFDDPGPRNG